MPSVRVNGVRLNYVDKGEGPPIVLSHGFQNSVFAFKPILDRLECRQPVACCADGADHPLYSGRP